MWVKEPAVAVETTVVLLAVVFLVEQRHVAELSTVEQPLAQGLGSVLPLLTTPLATMAF